MESDGKRAASAASGTREMAKKGNKKSCRFICHCEQREKREDERSRSAEQRSSRREKRSDARLLISILILRQIANTDTHLTINNRSAYPCIYVAYNLCFRVRKKDMFGWKV